MRLLLDTNLLGKLCHPKQYADVKAWFSEILGRPSSITVALPEVADYELRRALIRGIRQQQIEPKSLDRLNAFGKLLDYQALTTPVMQDAASLWAQARIGGYPTAPEEALDGDVILAAQAREEPAVVVTSNRKHLTRYGVEAKDWSEISIPSEPNSQQP